MVSFFAYCINEAGQRSKNQMPSERRSDGILFTGNLLFDDLVQFALGITACHFFQRNRFDFACLTFATERKITVEADLLHRFNGFAQVFARIKVGRVFGKVAAYRAGGSEAQVGIDVDFAHAVFDAFDDFFNRHAVGFADIAAVFVDDFQPFLRNGASRASRCVYWAGLGGFP